MTAEEYFKENSHPGIKNKSAIIKLMKGYAASKLSRPEPDREEIIKNAYNFIKNSSPGGNGVIYERSIVGMAEFATDFAISEIKRHENRQK